MIGKQSQVQTEATAPIGVPGRIVSLSEFLARHKNFVEALESMSPAERTLAFDALQESLSRYVGTIASFATAHRLLEVAGEICSQMASEELLARIGCDRRLPPHGPAHA